MNKITQIQLGSTIYDISDMNLETEVSSIKSKVIQKVSVSDEKLIVTSETIGG